jgi:hypothetical protein
MTMRSGASTESPVSNSIYNLLQALTSKLEAIEAYGKYRADARSEVSQLFEDLASEDQRQAERLLSALRDELR